MFGSAGQQQEFGVRRAGALRHERYLKYRLGQHIPAEDDLWFLLRP
jgi:hypothetical protein